MTLDTKQKRGSAIGLLSPGRQWLAEPTGTLGVGSRQSLLALCSAVLAAGGAATSLAVTRTPLVGSPVEYEAADTDAARGDALEEALGDHISGDTYALVEDGFDLTASGQIAIFNNSSGTIEGAGDGTVIDVSAGNLLELTGSGTWNFADFKVTSGAFVSLSSFTGTCNADAVNGPGITNVFDASSGSGALNWSNSTARSIGPTGLTTNLTSVTLSSNFAEVIDASGGEPGTRVFVTDCTLSTTAAGQVAILVGFDSEIHLHSGSVTSAADGLDIDNSAGGYVCVRPTFDYDPLKTSGVISLCVGRLIYPWVMDGGFIYDEIHGGYMYYGTPSAAPDQIGAIGLPGSSAITPASISEAKT